MRNSPLYSILFGAGLLAWQLPGFPSDRGAAEERWSVAKAWEWYNEQPWLVGCNFLPSTAVNDVEMWQQETFDPSTIDRELGLAQDLGFNTVRVFVNYIVWHTDPPGLKSRLNQFLEIADRHQIRVMLILFDDCFKPEPQAGPQPDPEPGVHNSQWVQSPGAARRSDRSAWPQLEEYVRDVVGAFAQDDRVLAWDLYNEPSQSAELVRAAFRWARLARPKQPLTSCWLGVDDSDVLSFHCYGDLKAVREEIDRLEPNRRGRPYLCTEWMARGAGSRFETHLPYFKEQQIGCWSWGLVAGRTQTYYPWGSPKGAPEPKLWHHDIFRTNGEPFDPLELRFLRQFFAGNRPFPLRRLMDTPLRDPSICRGPDATWYLTGTVEPFWGYNEGIQVWKSSNLTNWTPLGMVWRYGTSIWHKPYLEAKKPLWAPEIHYLKNTFWLTYSMPGWDGTAKTSGSGLLKSTSGQVEGPYVDMHPEERLGDEIDASLFEDTDGSVYFLWHSGKIARLKPDLSGLAEPYHWLKAGASDPDPKHHSSLCAGIFGTNSLDHVGYEGMFLFKTNGRYYLSCAENFEGRYSCAVAISSNLLGPYSPRYEAIRHGGHNMFFPDAGGRWWSTYFGSDGLAPWRERAGILPVRFDVTGEVWPKW